MLNPKKLPPRPAQIFHIFLGNRDIRKVLAGVIIATILFLGLSAYLDLRAADNLGNMAKQQFNDQQMVIARHIKRQVESELLFIRRELDRVCDIIYQGNANISAVQPDLEPTLSRLLEKNVYQIHILDLDDQKTYSFGYPRLWQAKNEIEHTFDDLTTGLKGSRLFFSKPNHESGGMLIHMSRQVKDTRKVLVIKLDITRFFGRFLDDVRSGSTGYSWVIDSNGTFVYHPYTRFVGKSAFTAREKRDPGMAFHSINFIQRNQMLAGHTGTGSYTAGWHRGFTGKIEKLIAYCPVIISDMPADTWSVAVVAPVSEIDGYIRQTAFWRFLFHKHLKMPKMGGLDLLRQIKKIRPDTSAIIMTAYATIETAVEAIQEGAYDYITKPFRRERILLTIDKALQWRRMIYENMALREELVQKDSTRPLLGSSNAIKSIIQEIRQMAPTTATVLITGPSGTGRYFSGCREAC